MPYVKGKKYPYTDKGKQAAYDAANNISKPITDVMDEPSLDMKSKLKPYKLKQGLV